MNKRELSFGYSIRYMDVMGKIFDETLKGFEFKEYAQHALEKLLSDMEGTHEIIAASVHAYPPMPPMIFVIGNSIDKEIIAGIQDGYSLKGYVALDNTYSTKSLEHHQPEVLREYENRLLEVSFFKIKISDLIYVVNPDLELEETAKQQLSLARVLGKDIIYMREDKEDEQYCD